MDPRRISYTLIEACDATGIGRSKMYKYINAGLITPKKSGRSNIFLREDLVKLVQNLPDSDIPARHASGEYEHAAFGRASR